MIATGDNSRRCVFKFGNQPPSAVGVVFTPKHRSCSHPVLSCPGISVGRRRPSILRAAVHVSRHRASRSRLPSNRFKCGPPAAQAHVRPARLIRQLRNAGILDLDRSTENHRSPEAADRIYVLLGTSTTWERYGVPIGKGADPRG